MHVDTMDDDLTLEAVRALADDLRRQVSGLGVDEEAPQRSWKATRIHFRPGGAARSALTVVSGSQALDVHFGSGLVLETGARTTAEAAGSVAMASELVRSIARDGFLEQLWVRDGEVVAAETTIPLGTGAERFRRRGLSSLRRASRLTEAHDPW